MKLTNGQLAVQYRNVYTQCLDSYGQKKVKLSAKNLRKNDVDLHEHFLKHGDLKGIVKHPTTRERAEFLLRNGYRASKNFVRTLRTHEIAVQYVDTDSLDHILDTAKSMLEGDASFTSDNMFGGETLVPKPL